MASRSRRMVEMVRENKSSEIHNKETPGDISHEKTLIWLYHIKLLLFLIHPDVEGAVMAPPWANPKLNPCATQPRGWQLLYWPPDGKCYRIFQMGHPCPEGMELTPSISKSGQKLSVECRCPPKTALSTKTGKCYELFTIGPCDVGYYFGPNISNNEKAKQLGICTPQKACPNDSMIFWPKNGQCYKLLTRGPCPKGQLLITDPKNALPICACGDLKELKDFRTENGHCYQHFTRGPCWEKGHLFLPDKSCGCYDYLPHYHEETQMCYEVESRGPCDRGQLFLLNSETGKAECQCKQGYIRYLNSTGCYRPYTQGPCDDNHFLIDSTTCLEQPCSRGYLYHPQTSKCFRIGTREPCSQNLIFTFDFDTRPSIDGISYNGVCRCPRKNCDKNELDNIIFCDRSKGLVKYQNGCHKMYTQGPCFRGSWLVPQRQGKQDLYNDGSAETTGVCECIPGYKRSFRSVGDKNVTVCLSPTVMLADYMNKNYELAQITGKNW